jgi:hypothetical protein
MEKKNLKEKKEGSRGDREPYWQAIFPDLKKIHEINKSRKYNKNDKFLKFQMVTSSWKDSVA